MKLRTSLRRLCTSCYMVRRQGRLFVYCKANPRHKQRQGRGARRKLHTGAEGALEGEAGGCGCGDHHHHHADLLPFREGLGHPLWLQQKAGPIASFSDLVATVSPSVQALVSRLRGFFSK